MTDSADCTCEAMGYRGHRPNCEKLPPGRYTTDSADARATYHRIAVEAVDKFVTLHCAPDRITLTHGAMTNLSYVIVDAIMTALRAQATQADRDAWERDGIQSNRVAGLIQQVAELKARLAEVEGALREAVHVISLPQVDENMLQRWRDALTP